MLEEIYEPGFCMYVIIRAVYPELVEGSHTSAVATFCSTQEKEKHL